MVHEEKLQKRFSDFCIEHLIFNDQSAIVIMPLHYWKNSRADEIP